MQYSPSCPTNSVRAVSSYLHRIIKNLKKIEMQFLNVFLLQLRGDPDGCGGLDASDSGPLRKGWLLKQTNNVINNDDFEKLVKEE